MDAILCDELLQEIFRRLPSPSAAAVSLVSKRWLCLFRSSRTHLSLRLCPYSFTAPLLASFLSNFPFLSSLSLTTATAVSGLDVPSFSDHLLLSAASSCPNLRQLRLFTGPVSVLLLLSLSACCPNLSSLAVALARPISLYWIDRFRSLKDLCIIFSAFAGESDSDEYNSNFQHSDATARKFPDELQLETLSLCGTRQDDCGLDWLWMRCKRLKKLQLRSCEGIGDDSSLSSFVKCVNGLQELEFRTCRTIVDAVLLKLAENCASLKSLLVYDGGSREGLLQFISQSRCNLQKLDLRLPLDLDNSHLMAVAENYREVSSLRLQSCCLVTGEGLKTIGAAMGGGLEELALINCDVVEREPGLLATLGQNLRRLKKLDLSYNEMMIDKELISMLVSCNELIELKLRGCKGLTNLAVVSILKNCGHLESVDLMYCRGIEAEAVELFVLNSRRLRQVKVEESKLSEVARTWASIKFVEVVV